MKASVEELGMLKILEHLVLLIATKRQITAKEICQKTGMAEKYLKKLIEHNLIDVSRKANKPYYQWTSIKPNALMAREVLKDNATFSEIYAKELGSVQLPELPQPTKHQKNKSINEAKISECYKLEYKRGRGFNWNSVNGPTTNGWGILIKSLAVEDLMDFAEYFSPYEKAYPLWTMEIGEVADIFNAWRKSRGLIIKHININFDQFWNLYDKKEDKDKCEKKWNALTDSERLEIMEKLPPYIEATPDKKFRKNPFTYLNNKAWNNEIVKHVYLKSPDYRPKERTPIQEYADNELWDELKRRGYNGTISKSLQ